MIVGGANQLLSSEDIAKAEALISGAKVLICQLEVPPDTSLAAIQLARKNKGKYKWKKVIWKLTFIECQ